MFPLRLRRLGSTVFVLIAVLAVTVLSFAWEAPAPAVSWPRPPNATSPACVASVPPQRGATARRNCATQTGIASWYGKEHQGQPTANGEIYDPNHLTAAHATLPMNTRVRVTHVATGRTVIVRINDRGPYVAGRIIDVSEKAAELLGFKTRGLATVRLEIVD